VNSKKSEKNYIYHTKDDIIAYYYNYSDSWLEWYNKEATAVFMVEIWWGSSK